MSYNKCCVPDGGDLSDKEGKSGLVASSVHALDQEEIGIDIDGVRDKLGIKYFHAELDPKNGGAHGMHHNPDPVNEFLKPDSVITSAFPTVFMLGRAYRKPVGRLSGHT